MSDSLPPASPPPHPYAVPEGRSGHARGTLSIAAMASGLAGLMTAAVSALYFAPGAMLAALFGAGAIILAILGIVSRLQRVPAVVGLVSGALSVVLAAGTGALLLVTAALPSASSTDASSSGPLADSGIAWPANMATGGVSLTADGVTPTGIPRSGAPEPSASVGTAHRVQLYVDYRCPSCARFDEHNGAALEQVVSSGQATLELIPLSFLDRIGTDAYSSRAAGALACVVDTQPAAAWAVNERLFDVQPAETAPGLSNDQLIEAVDAASGGISDATRSCIADERFSPFAQALNTWVFSNPVPFAADAELAVTGTPFVVVDGVPYSGDIDDSRAFTAFLAQQGITVGSES